MNRPLFITGIGTGIGKTVVSAIVAEALEADYWKPVQAGLEGITDKEWVRQVVTNKNSVIHDELYRLLKPASPHIAAREEGLRLSVDEFVKAFPETQNRMIIEGAGGLMVPLNEKEFVADLILALNARVILVSRNYLGSINHSLLTAAVCKSRNIDVIGWVFNDHYLSYENEIADWTKHPKLLSVPFTGNCNSEFVKVQARALLPELSKWL